MIQSIDDIKNQWIKIGFGFTGEPHKGEVDVEQLIIDSLSRAREDERLFSALITWAAEYGDLINLSRLKTHMRAERSSLMGCWLEVALKEGADNKLRALVKLCRPEKKREVLFHSMKKFKVTEAQEKKECLPLFSKWGFYASSYSVKRDALMRRNWILNQNFNLAMRQLFGANARSEILGLLMGKARLHIKEIADKIRMSYPPIYYEISSMIQSGIVSCEVIGRIKLISITDKTKSFLKALPF